MLHRYRFHWNLLITIWIMRWNIYIYAICCIFFRLQSDFSENVSFVIKELEQFYGCLCRSLIYNFVIINSFQQLRVWSKVPNNKQTKKPLNHSLENIISINIMSLHQFFLKIIYVLMGPHIFIYCYWWDVKIKVIRNS